jgi:hypothetical protein
VLAFARPENDGAWPPKAVRDLVERIGSDAIERGIQTATFNRRGVTMRSPTAGGAKERMEAFPYP